MGNSILIILAILISAFSVGLSIHTLIRFNRSLRMRDETMESEPKE